MQWDGGTWINWRWLYYVISPATSVCFPGRPRTPVRSQVLARQYYLSPHMRWRRWQIYDDAVSSPDIGHSDTRCCCCRGSQINVVIGQNVSNFTLRPIGERSIVMTLSVCSFFCLPASISQELHVRSTPIFVHILFYSGSVLFWQWVREWICIAHNS